MRATRSSPSTLAAGRPLSSIAASTRPGSRPRSSKSVGDLVAHPQLAARRRWREIETENGTVQALLPPATFADVEAAMGDVPALGQHTVAILREAGLDERDIERLIATGAAHQHGRDAGGASNGGADSDA